MFKIEDDLMSNWKTFVFIEFNKIARLLDECERLCRIVDDEFGNCTEETREFMKKIREKL